MALFVQLGAKGIPLGPLAVAAGDMVKNQGKAALREHLGVDAAAVVHRFDQFDLVVIDAGKGEFEHIGDLTAVAMDLAGDGLRQSEEFPDAVLLGEHSLGLLDIVGDIGELEKAGKMVAKGGTGHGRYPIVSLWSIDPKGPGNACTEQSP